MKQKNKTVIHKPGNAKSQGLVTLSVFKIFEFQ